MKKLNYMLLGLAGLAMASCSQEDLVGPSAGNGNVNITVNLPQELGTRALSDGLTANVLRYAVYDADNGNAFVFDDVASFGGNISTTVSMNLPQGKSYNIAFFAVSKEADGTLYVWNDNADTPNITVNYEDYGSDANLADDYDCFYKLHATGVIPSTSTSQSVTLTRPVAQVNWGTSDLSQAVVDENAFGPNGKYILSNFTISHAYTQFSLLDGDVYGDEVAININALASPASNEESAVWSFPVEPSTYKYIAMQYVLAPANQMLFNVALDVYNEQGNVDNEAIVVNNTPLQANYRTNIYGALLTNPNEFTVTKDKNWNADYDPSLELALQRGGTFTLEHDFTLSQSYYVEKNLTINLNGYNITYGAAGGDNYDDTNEGMLYVTNGANLTINGEGGINEDAEYTLIWVDGGTLTINGGSYQAPAAAGNIVYVSAGTAYIKGGSFKLEGQVFNATEQYPINCQDASYDNGTANIIVTGGTFFNFDPSDNKAEGGNKHTSFVAEGYESVQTGSGDELYFTVVPNGTLIATDNASLSEAVKNVKENGTILVAAGTYDTFPSGASLPKGVTIECEEGTVFNVTAANININGGTLNGAKFTWSKTGASTRTITGTLNGNYVNCEFTGYEAVRYAYAGETCNFEGCTFSGSLYGCHFDGGANDVTFKDCTFQGFNAFGAAITLLTMDNCTFSANGLASYNGVNLWGTTEMTDCYFIFDGSVADEWIDAKKELTMTNCYINNIPASSPQVADYFETANYGNITFN